MSPFFVPLPSGDTVFFLASLSCGNSFLLQFFPPHTHKFFFFISWWIFNVLHFRLKHFSGEMFIDCDSCSRQIPFFTSCSHFHSFSFHSLAPVVKKTLCFQWRSYRQTLSTAQTNQNSGDWNERKSRAFSVHLYVRCATNGQELEWWRHMDVRVFFSFATTHSHISSVAAVPAVAAAALLIFSEIGERQHLRKSVSAIFGRNIISLVHISKWANEAPHFTIAAWF